MKLITAIKEKAGQAGERIEAFLDHNDKKIAMGGAMAVGAVVVMQIATGDAQAVVNTTETVKYYGLSTISWIISVLAVVFGIGTLWLEDYRMALLTVALIAGAVVVNYLGL